MADASTGGAIRMDARLPLAAVADEMDVTERTVRGWIDQGELAAEHRENGAVLVWRPEVRRFQCRQMANVPLVREAVREPWANPASHPSPPTPTPPRPGSTPSRLHIVALSAWPALVLLGLGIVAVGDAERAWAAAAAAGLGAAGAWLGAWMALGTARDWRGYRASARWPQTVAVIVHSSLREYSTASRYGLGVTYDYTVDGTHYLGTRVAFALATMDEPAANEAAFFFSPGMTLPVRYDPADPRHAVLVRYVTVWALALRLLGGIAVALGSLALAVLYLWGG